jgi:hypothetical protein
MSLQSRSVSAGADSPPPRRLSPLRLVALAVGQPAVEREGRAVAQFDRVVAEAADADLRSLQVAEQRDLAARACRQGAHQRGASAVIIDLCRARS